MICAGLIAVYLLLVLWVCALCRAGRVDDYAVWLADLLLGDRERE